MFRPLIILALPLTLLSAQGGPPAPKEKSSRKLLKQEQILVHLHRLRMERLQQALGLPEDRAKAIADRWARFDRDSHENRQALRRLQQQANAILMSPLPEEEKNTKVRPLVDQFTAIRQQQNDLRRNFEAEAGAGLTPAQQARFILLAEEIQRAMIEAIKKQRSGGQEPLN